MATAIFDVTPENLEASAKRIEQKCDEFKKEYEKIYTAVADLRVTYKGEASDAFNKKIEGYRNDFNAAELALKKYVEFLREYASKVKGTETDIKSKAEALSTGK